MRKTLLNTTEFKAEVLSHIEAYGYESIIRKLVTTYNLTESGASGIVKLVS